MKFDIYINKKRGFVEMIPATPIGRTVCKAYRKNTVVAPISIPYSDIDRFIVFASKITCLTFCDTELTDTEIIEILKNNRTR